jgi:hypothetical protein
MLLPFLAPRTRHKEFENEDEESGQGALALFWVVQTESFKEAYVLPMELDASSANSRAVISVSRKLDFVVHMARRERNAKSLAAHVLPFKVGSALDMAPKKYHVRRRVAEGKHLPMACAEFMVTPMTLKSVLLCRLPL